MVFHRQGRKERLGSEGSNFFNIMHNTQLRGVTPSEEEGKLKNVCPSGEEQVT